MKIPPESAEDLLSILASFHQTISQDGWIILRCVACQRGVMAATHMDLWGFANKAISHSVKYHLGGIPDTPDSDPGCWRCSE